MTSRARTEENITRTREAVAPRINIDWNPVDNGGKAIFNLQDMITENGEYRGLERHATLRPDWSRGEMLGEMRVRIPDILAATITLEGQDYPGYLLMGLIKQFFDDEYTRRLLAQEAEDALVAQQPEESEEDLPPGEGEAE